MTINDWLKKRRKKYGTVERNMRRIIVVSPVIWIIINFIFLGMAFLMFPDEMYVSKSGMMLIIFLIVNGWFFAGILLTYLFRDGSHKFMCHNLSTSLGMDDGFVGWIPPEKIGETLIEPQYTCRLLSGFCSRFYGIHTQGRVLAFYPTSEEQIYPGGGVAVNVVLRTVLVANLPKSIKTWILKQGGSFGIYKNPDVEVLFARLPFYAKPTERERININLDLKIDELNERIDYLEARCNEQALQIATMTQERSLWLYHTRIGRTDIDKYKETSEEVFEEAAGYKEK